MFYLQAVPATTPSATDPQGTPSVTPGSTAQYPSTTDFNQYNPYVASSMYSSSFMSQEGSQNIQSMMGGAQSNAPAPVGYGAYPQPPQQVQGAPPMAGAPPYAVPGPPQYPPGYPPGSFPPQAQGGQPQPQPHPQYPQGAPQQYPGGAYPGYPGYQPYPPPPTQPGYDAQCYPGPYQGAPRGPPGQQMPHGANHSSITTVRISGR